MSVSLKKAQGLTVLTVMFDSGAPLSSALLCQLLCLLRFGSGVSPFKTLPNPPHGSQCVFGALQIMIGALTIGLGLIPFHNVFNLYYALSYPTWFGFVFIVVGITSILSERFSCQCMTVVSVILNLCGVIFALATMITYSFWISDVWDTTDSCRTFNSPGSWDEEQSNTSLFPVFRERCFEGRTLVFMLQRSVLCLLFALSCLEMCVVYTSATQNINTLKTKSEDMKKLELKSSNHH